DPFIMSDAELVGISLLETGHRVLANQHGIECPAFEQRLPLPHKGRREQPLAYVFVYVGEFVNKENGPDIAPALPRLNQMGGGEHAGAELLKGGGDTLEVPGPVMFEDIGHIKVMHEPLVQRIDAGPNEAALCFGGVNGPQAKVDGEVRRPEAFRQLPQYRRLPRPFLPVEHETLAEWSAGELVVNAVQQFLAAEEHLLLLDRGAA